MATSYRIPLPDGRLHEFYATDEQERRALADL